MRIKALCVICALIFAGCATQAQSQSSAVSTQSLSRLLLNQGYMPVPLRRVGNGLDTVTLSINGAAGTFLLDTGASNSVIDSRLLPKFRIAPQNLRRSDTAIGAGGDVTLSSYSITGLTFNRKNYPLREISTADISSIISAFQRDTGIKLDGIIGQDVMISFDGVIDTKSRTLFLRQR